MNHIISTHQFEDRDKLLKLFQVVEKYQRGDWELKPWSYNTPEQIFFVLFYEPSTRTRFSFETAILKLGGHVVSSESAAQFSSAVKGESISDSIRVLAQYQPAAIILRHPQRGAAELAVKALPDGSKTAIINAGDGDGEHPTQSLLDAYTIWTEIGRLDDLEIALIGDLKYGRTVHSLIHLLKYSQNIKFHLVAPEALQLPEEYLTILLDRKISFQLHTDIQELPKTIDVAYMTRLQLERFPSSEWVFYEAAHQSKYYITKSWLETLKPEARILHPLPRVKEIEMAVDADLRAAYFRQAGNGLPVRMALLAAIKKDPYPYCHPFVAG